MTSLQLLPFALDVSFADRVWGRRSLAPWYSEDFVEPVGEAWLTGPQCKVTSGAQQGSTLAQLCAQFPEALTLDGGADFPLLIKMLFPDEKLSVQVHPDDAHAARLGGTARAKTECWYVLDAVPGATVALGLKTGTTLPQVEDALGSPAFEDLLQHEPLTAGDMVYVEAGTVHAIAGGLTLLEVQQASDTTFRLYDYGRPRELHLTDGLAVTKLETSAGRVAPQSIASGTRLIAKPHFTVDLHRASVGAGTIIPPHHGPAALISLRGIGAIVTANGSAELQPGHAVVLPARSPAYVVEGDCQFIHCFVR